MRDLPRIVVTNWTIVPKSLLADVEEEKQRLTFRNNAKRAAAQRGYESDAPDYFELWEEDDECLYVPRAHKPKLKPGLLKGRDFVLLAPHIVNPDPIDLGVDQVKLGPNERQPYDQQPAFDALVGGTPHMVPWPYGRQLILRCGAGKTYIALKAAFQRHARTLWVTMNTSLVEQARRNITEALGIANEDIGHVQADVEDWSGYKIATAMLQTLARHQYDEEFYRYWDLVIFDEGDVLGAEHFSKVIHQFPCERWLLTATQKRNDGMHIMYDLHVGPVCYEDTEYDLIPDCYFMRTGADKKHELRAGWDPIKRQKPVNYNLTATSLMRDDNRRNLVMGLLDTALNEEDRTVLLLGDSVDGLLMYSEAARERFPQYAVGTIVGKVAQKQRDTILKQSYVVFATTALAYRGLDLPALDTLFVLTITNTSEARWRQAVGRILRYTPNKHPKVVILVDENIPGIVGMAGKLVRMFERFGWRVHNGEWIKQATKRRK